jgi:glycosyltransferase involved in cell wall biosynthesis
MISVIIPTKNEERYLASTLAGLKAYAGCETIVSDGRSTDATLDIARRDADRVVVHVGNERQTIAAGRNLGAAQASGEFLVFIDADVEIPDPANFFARALAAFERDPQLVAMAVALRVRPDLATWMDRIVFVSAGWLMALFNNWLHIGAAQGEFQMIRTDAFRHVGGYREDLVSCEDHDLFHRLSQIGRTRMELGLVVFHTGRRAHKVGWPKLLWQWAVDCAAYVFINRSVRKEWEVVR